MARTCGSLAMAALAASPSFNARAQEGTVRIVLGFPAGAASDVLCRVLAEHVRHSLGQPVIVDNKPAAGGVIANEVVKTAGRKRPSGTTAALG